MFVSAKKSGEFGFVHFPIHEVWVGVLHVIINTTESVNSDKVLKSKARWERTKGSLNV